MAPVSSTTTHDRENRRGDNQVEIKNLLEEVWGFDPDESFYETFSNEAKKGV